MVWQKNRNQYHNTIIASVINLNDSHEAAPRSDCAAEQFGGLFQEAAEIIWLARFRPASLPSAPSEAGWIMAVCVWRRMNSNNKRRNVRLVKQSLKACFFWPVLRKNWCSKKVQSDFLLLQRSATIFTVTGHHSPCTPKGRRSQRRGRSHYTIWEAFQTLAHNMFLLCLFSFHLHVIVSPPSWASAGSAGGVFPLKGTFFLPTVDKCFSWGGERLLYNTCWWELPLFNSTELTGWGMNLQRLVNIMDTESILVFLAHL